MKKLNNEAFKIRTAGIGDLKEIEALNNKYFHEQDRDFKKYVTDENYQMIVAEEREVVGFAGFKKQNWNKSLEVIDIFVHPRFRKQGVGTKLLQKLINLAKNTKARVIIAEAPSNNPVVFLYKKCGFRKCGYNDRYYNNQGSEQAIFMSLDLK